MKFILFLFAVVLAVSMSSAATARINKEKRDTSDERPACDIGCTFMYEPVCGYDGAEYKSFGNACMMKKHNCEVQSKGQNYETVDMSNCPEMWVD